jgi:hypothetical protein
MPTLCLFGQHRFCSKLTVSASVLVRGPGLIGTVRMEWDTIDSYFAITEAFLDSAFVASACTDFIPLIADYSTFAVSASVRTSRSFAVYAAVS